MEKEIKQKKQDLGIFYTDQRIINFIYDILKIWKEKEDKKNGRWESRKHYPSVIDPAVGEGAFLKAAVQNGFTKTDYIFGLDIDEDAVKKWKKINLLKEFGGKEDDLTAHFFHQNGLDKIHWEQHIKKYRYKLKRKDIEVQQFDTVVGNPPYGGIGIDFKKNPTRENFKILEILKDFEIFGFKKLKINNNQEKELKKTSLFGKLVQDSPNNYKLSISEVSKMAEGMPIEILFLERFIQLAKPGGWIAIIIPDGILTNSNSHYVRGFISQKAKVEAIISLPRVAFKNVGTSAKTSILFLRKYEDQEKKQKDYNVFLASVESLDDKNFDFIRNNYKKYYNKNMSNKNLVQITTDERGKEVVVVRVDKTLKEIMEEKPSSRWNVDYWHPKYEKILKIINKFEIMPLDNFISKTVSGYRGKTEYISKGGIQSIEAVSMLASGIGVNPNLSRRVKISGVFDSESRRTKIGDLLFARSGVGTAGRSALVTSTSKNMVIGGHILKVELNGKIPPEYIQVYLKTSFGWEMLDRVRSGVGALVLDEEDVRAIVIPILEKETIKNIQLEFKKVSKYHDKAMEANNETELKENIKIAEKMFKDLIAKTEAVIRGEKKDVI